MPELIGETIDAERERKLREWLAKPEAKTFQTVLAAKSRLLQERALREAFKSDGTNTYDLKSIDSMKAAARFETALQVLSEVAGQEAPYQIIKLKL